MLFLHRIVSGHGRPHAFARSIRMKRSYFGPKVGFSRYLSRIQTIRMTYARNTPMRWSGGSIEMLGTRVPGPSPKNSPCRWQPRKQHRRSPVFMALRLRIRVYEGVLESVPTFDECLDFSVGDNGRSGLLRFGLRLTGGVQV